MEHIKKTFYSKRSVVLGLLILGFIVLGVVAVDDVVFLSSLLIITLLLAILWFGTRYVISGNYLIIRIGPINFSKIDIKTITSIADAKGNLMSSPANSFDRILVKYGELEEVLLSPKNRKGFIDELIKVNTLIKIDNNLT